MAVDLSSYLTVAERIAEFRAKHPEGCLQPVNLNEPFKIVTIGDKTYITYVAAAYRSPDDRNPGIGVAWEPWPGKTPYTRDSELMNAETSAWGRAIVATLASDTTVGIATQEEIRNRQAESASGPPPSMSNVRRIPVRAENGENAGSADLANLLKRANDANTLDLLRDVWKDVGNSGLLNAQLAENSNVTFQEYLYQRSDELNPKSGDGGSLDGTPGKGNARPSVAGKRGVN